jgi:broad specificity phosphatase PhoE
MDITRFFLIRHALVAPAARAILYGDMDVALCDATLLEEAALHRWLAARLPRPARWFVTPLSRTRATAEAIFAAGHPAQTLSVVPALAEQNLGEWQGITHEALTERLLAPAHPSGRTPPRNARPAARAWTTCAGASGQCWKGCARAAPERTWWSSPMAARSARPWPTRSTCRRSRR